MLNVVLLHYGDSGFYYILLKRFIAWGAGYCLFWFLPQLAITLVELKPQTLAVGLSISILGSVILFLARLPRVCPMHACLRRFGQSFYAEFEAFSFWDSRFTFQWLWWSQNLSLKDCMLSVGVLALSMTLTTACHQAKSHKIEKHLYVFSFL